MKRFLKTVSALLAAMIAVGMLASCSPAKPVDMKAIAAVIDVRTPAEVATGHLQGSVNIDISSPDFASQIDELDHAANYVIYCHSGNRAGQAISYMQSAGFSGNLVNAGGVDSASQLTGLKITN
ncbi:MAG: hypothetical protein RL556_458 [Actinomycetota bacterium]